MFFKAVFVILSVNAEDIMKKILLTVFLLFSFLFFSQDKSLAFNLDDRHDVFTPAFQLLWSDLGELVAKKKINFRGIDPKVAYVLNANKFTTNDISEESYYKIVAPKSYELKAKIQREIFEKFGETSEVLDDIDWQSKGINEYILYSLLIKNVEFPVEFDVLNNQSFNGSKEMYKFFGTKEYNRELASQIKPLFYLNDWDYAVSLETKSGDRVILYRTKSQQNVYDIYAQMDVKTNKYLKFAKGDELKVPFISVDEKIQYDGICNKKILGTKYIIAKAIDDIKFNLDNKGANLRNEAIMDVVEMSMPIPRKGVKYDFSKSFVLFMVEKDKSLPYFALRINDGRFLVK